MLWKKVGFTARASRDPLRALREGAPQESSDEDK